MKPVLPLLLLSIFSSLLTAAKSPNFIIIYTDDLGYADTSVQMMDADPSSKHKFIHTPGLERLADIGARFNAGYSPTPTCTGSRVSIQFGKSSAQMHYRNVFDVLSPIQRPDGYGDETTMAEMLKAAGQDYVTAFFGKGCGAIGRYDESGYDVTDENTPNGNGNGHGIYWNPDTKEPFPKDDPKRLHSLRKDSVGFINEYAGKQPFFLMVSHYAAHIPFMATEGAIERNRKRWIEQGGDVKQLANAKSKENKDILYAAMIEEMDMTVGGIIDALKAKGELDNTYIIFTSDNGGGYAERREVNGVNERFNGPLQGGKRSMWEGGLRVPTIIAGPGIEAGSECDVPIVQWDFLPTFHDLSGSTGPLPEGTDGGSLRDVFANGNQGIVERGAPGIVHHYTCHYHPPISSIIIGDFRLMKHLVSGETKLFNIKDDYQQEHDLAATMPEKVASMEAIRQQYVDEVDGGEMEVVYDALYNLMDEFGRRARVEYERKLAELLAENPADMAERKAALLAKYNATLKRNAVSKEKSRLYSESNVWKEYPYAQDAKRNIEATWVDVIE
jgi:arylsulfatase A-like enzyme